MAIRNEWHRPTGAPPFFVGADDMLDKVKDKIMRYSRPAASRTLTPGSGLIQFLRSLVFCLLVAGVSATAWAAPAHKVTGDTLTLDFAEIQKPWHGDLEALVKRRVIRVLTVNSKTFYFHDKGVQYGTVVDSFRLFEAELNKKLAAEKKLKNKNLKVRVVFIPMRRDELLPALAAGRGDIAAANLTITPQRRETVDFTVPGMANVSEVVVSGPSSPKVGSLDDLSGKEVFVRKSSSYYDSLVALNAKFSAAGKSPVRLKEAPEILEDEDLLEMLNAGLVTLIVVDKHKADFWKQIFPRLSVHADITVRVGGEVAWALRKDMPELKAVLDDFITRHRVGTVTGDQLLKRYLKSVKYVTNAASDDERKKFMALIQYFQKYGNKYDVDWLLMGAQGYQESALNQKAKSPVGAIGVMQLMPATGKDMNVGDITEVEANIHAGIKYMRWMITQYYDKEAMTPLDKALFSFASYNAGAGRVAQLRKEAARRGLDANVWFQNVELVAAEKIGQETVNYVSNIYKYYIAYRLILESRAAQQDAVQDLRRGAK
jgi:membrane-bound lytic murein transglycosylase MltF